MNSLISRWTLTGCPPSPERQNPERETNCRKRGRQGSYFTAILKMVSGGCLPAPATSVPIPSGRWRAEVWTPICLSPEQAAGALGPPDPGAARLHADPPQAAPDSVPRPDSAAVWFLPTDPREATNPESPPNPMGPLARRGPHGDAGHPYQTQTLPLTEKRKEAVPGLRARGPSGPHSELGCHRSLQTHSRPAQLPGPPAARVLGGPFLAGVSGLGVDHLPAAASSPNEPQSTLQPVPSEFSSTLAPTPPRRCP
uniref:collagen alpha-1(I) chain-like n=1 Tax=Ictidomys tridecemlineatus TaxID=43179 RepID=UPI001A9F3C69|nr:collagen alpha-1(I) chain-like [Ictidomys tridecemlineatus]